MVAFRRIARAGPRRCREERHAPEPAHPREVRQALQARRAARDRARGRLRLRRARRLPIVAHLHTTRREQLRALRLVHVHAARLLRRGREGRGRKRAHRLRLLVRHPPSRAPLRTQWWRREQRRCVLVACAGRADEPYLLQCRFLFVHPREQLVPGHNRPTHVRCRGCRACASRRRRARSKGCSGWYAYKRISPRLRLRHLVRAAAQRAIEEWVRLVATVAWGALARALRARRARGWAVLEVFRADHLPLCPDWRLPP